MRSQAKGVGFGLLMAGVVVVLGGCVTERPARIGLVDKVTVPGNGEKAGDQVPDFVYYNEKGAPVRFSESRGEVTLLLFPDDRNWPDCRHCCELREQAYRQSRIHSEIAIVSIFVPRQSCQQSHDRFKACALEGHADLLTLCDPSGKIRAWFGPDAAGGFYVIDAEGRLVNQGRIDDRERMTCSLRKAVADNEDRYNRLYGPHEMDRPY